MNLSMAAQVFAIFASLNVGTPRTAPMSRVTSTTRINWDLTPISQPELIGI
jgi:hypothetical protein